jgi:hypothetical protein
MTVCTNQNMLDKGSNYELKVFMVVFRQLYNINDFPGLLAYACQMCAVYV